MTRILIADRQASVRSALRATLEAHPNWEVVAEAADGKVAIVKAIETKPDVIVLDFSLPLVDGLEVTRHIRARLRKTEVLIFTMHDDKALIQAALRAGTRGYLNKSDAACSLIEAVESLANHKPFFTSKVSETLLEAFLARPNRPGSMLTSQRKVPQLVGEIGLGKQNTTVADQAWTRLEVHFADHAQQVDRFRSAAASTIVTMWQEQRNEVGDLLSPFECEALIERHCELFGHWPQGAPGSSFPAVAR